MVCVQRGWPVLLPQAKEGPAVVLPVHGNEWDLILVDLYVSHHTDERFLQHLLLNLTVVSLLLPALSQQAPAEPLVNLAHAPGRLHLLQILFQDAGVHVVIPVDPVHPQELVANPSALILQLSGAQFAQRVHLVELESLRNVRVTNLLVLVGEEVLLQNRGIYGLLHIILGGPRQRAARLEPRDLHVLELREEIVGVEPEVPKILGGGDRDSHGARFQLLHPLLPFVELLHSLLLLLQGDPSLLVVHVVRDDPALVDLRVIDEVPELVVLAGLRIEVLVLLGDLVVELVALLPLLVLDFVLEVLQVRSPEELRLELLLRHPSGLLGGARRVLRFRGLDESPLPFLEPESGDLEVLLGEVVDVVVGVRIVVASAPLSPARPILALLPLLVRVHKEAVHVPNPFSALLIRVVVLAPAPVRALLRLLLYESLASPLPLVLLRVHVVVQEHGVAGLLSL